MGINAIKCKDDKAGIGKAIGKEERRASDFEGEDRLNKILTRMTLHEAAEIIDSFETKDTNVKESLLNQSLEMGLKEMVVDTAAENIEQKKYTNSEKSLFQDMNYFKWILLNLTYIAFFYIYFLFSYIFIIEPYQTKPDQLTDYLRGLNPETLLFYFLIFSILISFLSTYFGRTMKNQSANYNEKIFKFLMRYGDYYPLLPFSFIGIGFVLLTFSPFYPFLQFGKYLFLFGLFLFLVINFIKIYCENKIYYTLYNASENLKEISWNKKEQYNIKKFHIFFMKFLNNIDRKLDKGIKIDDMKIEDEDSLKKNTINIPIKNIITFYLPSVIKYGNQEQLDSLKNHTCNMLTLVNKNDEFKLNITKEILNIYSDIINFLIENRYLITVQKRKLNLSILNNKSIFEILKIIGTILMIVYIYLKK